ncbi:MAG TPA: citrate/2-methylcitrate synthase, partial [Gemmatimonadaceae bacterium]|nr:citrate/2-methylcitrate synthase [Gemmatimonadaceae bacterium]
MIPRQGFLHSGRPTTSHFRMWQRNIKMHTLVHENLKHFIEGFRYDAHPMGVFVSTLAGLSTFYPEAHQIRDAAVRQRQIFRLIAKAPTLA